MFTRERDFRHRKKLAPRYGRETSDKIDYKDINLLRNHIMEMAGSFLAVLQARLQSFKGT